MATTTGGTAKKTRGTKATGAELGELRKAISEISDADLTEVRGGIYRNLMLM
jgi:hypothetical protein